MKKYVGKVRILMAFMFVILTVVLFKNSNNNAVYAADSYTVSFMDDEKTVSEINVESSAEITVPEVTRDGYIFAGWYTSNVGNIADIKAAELYAYDFDSSIESNVILYAGWIDIGVGADSKFYLEGVQYRAADDNSSGIRFITRIDTTIETALKQLNGQNAGIRPESSNDKGIGYGTVVTMKSNIPENGMLIKDESARYVKTGMVVSPAAATYKFDGDNRYYTAVIRGITPRYFDTDMAARPYITYYDANGNVRTYYYTEHGTAANTYGGAYFTTYNKVKNAHSGGQEETTSEPETSTEAPEYGYPDVIVSEILLNPASPEKGDDVVFSAVVKNIGTASTPAGIITGVKFTVEGNSAYMWSDTYTKSIKPGETVVLTANGGVNGKAWAAENVGEYKVRADVDDVNRYQESNEYNNSTTVSYTVAEKSEIQYVTNPDTGKECLEGFNEYKFATLYNKELAEVNAGEFRVTSNGSLSDSDSEALTYSFTVKPDMYFNKAVDKILIDAAALKTSGAVINVYTGDNTEPVISTALPAAEKDLSSYSKKIMLDLSEAGMSSEESIRFDIVLTENSSDKDFELRSFRFMYSDIPTVYVNIDESLGTIDAMNSDPDKKTECHGSLLISSPAGYVGEYTGKSVKDYSLDMEYIRGRGNSTWEAPKKPYKVKLSKKTDLFGMGKNKHWCLIANYYDKSLMRNKLVYDFAEDIGMKYTPECVFVDVVMNGEYLGNYLLCEQIRVDSSRVDIDDLEDTPDATDEATISGGYLLELTPYERVKSDEVYFGASRVEKAMVFSSPSFETGINTAQYNYMRDYFYRMEEAVYSDSGYNSRGEYWSDLLDIDSAVDFYLVQEIFKNNDAMYASTRFYKPRGDKLYMGPVWDFDLTAGTYMCNNTENPEGWFVKNEYLYSALMRHSDFRDAVKARYWEIHDNITALYTDSDTALSKINKYSGQLDISQQINFDKWGYGNNGWQNILSQGKWDDEVSYLNSWLQRRIGWMDANINGIG